MNDVSSIGASIARNVPNLVPGIQNGLQLSSTANVPMTNLHWNPASIVESNSRSDVFVGGNTGIGKF